MSSDVLGLLGKVRPQIRDNPAPHEIVPHVYSFNALYQTYSRTYSYRFDEALRHMPQNALAMRRDVYIEALLQERFLPTSQRNWSIWVPNPADPRQAEVAKCTTNAIRAIPRFNSLRLNLLYAGWYGRYGVHLGLHQRRLDGHVRWTVNTHRPVNGDKIVYDWDGTPEVAINPLAGASYPPELVRRNDRGMTLLKLKRPEHRRQFIIHRHVVDDADYFEAEMGGAIHGVGLRSKIYWAWWMRDEMLSWAADFMQKVGTLGLLVFTYEEGNDRAMKKAEEAAGKASTEVALTMAIPPGQNTKATNAVQHIAPNNTGIDSLRGMIEEYWEKHIERMIVGQPSSGGTEGNGFGGSAGAALHADTKYQILKWDAGNLDETLSADLVGTLVDLNHGEVDFPVKFMSAVQSPEDAARLQAVTEAAALGTTFKMDEVRDLTGMAKPDEMDEVVGGAPAAGDPMDPNAPAGVADDDGGETEPGQGLTANSKLEREKGSQWSPIAAYADDGTYFEAYVEGNAAAGEAGGRWVTVGGVAGSDGKHHGGSPVFVRNGRIEKGHASLVGKEIGDEGRGGHIAVDRKKAEGLGGKADPFHVADLAADVRDHANAFAGEGGAKMSDDDAWTLAAKYATESGLDRDSGSEQAHKVSQLKATIEAAKRELAKLTGSRREAPPKAKGKPSGEVDPANAHHVDDLADLLAKADDRAVHTTPEFLKAAQDFLSRTADIKKDQLKAIARAAGLEGIYPDLSLEATRARIKNRLTVAKRTAERNEV
jgi:hypothetical protein